ncbi:MAG: hypothetical protein JXA92_07260 [candidate division Zixibacteria bacterium]|nr:hypothetical protein [candidate division Zixibacteria bacterium]
MEKDNQDKNYIVELLASLDERGLPLIDFDRLKQWLEMTASKWERYYRTLSELAVIREDYQQRVAGMVKALAAVDRKRDGWQQALELTESLNDMSARELVAAYRQTVIRFRDAFPASFGYLNSAPCKAAVHKNIEIYK